MKKYIFFLLFFFANFSSVVATDVTYEKIFNIITK